MARLAWIASEVGSGTGFPNGNLIHAETSTRPWSGGLAGRCVLYPPHSTPLLPPGGIVFTVKFHIVGNPYLTGLGKSSPLSGSVYNRFSQVTSPSRGFEV
jgi:hypothetical protein